MQPIPMNEKQSFQNFDENLYQQLTAHNQVAI